MMSCVIYRKPEEGGGLAPKILSVFESEKPRDLPSRVLEEETKIDCLQSKASEFQQASFS